MGENQKIIFVILVAFVTLSGVLFLSGNSETVIPNDETVVAECREDVLAAQDATLDKFCTQQFQNLRCPADDTFIYGAPNGCEISFLKDKGWTGL